MMPYLTVKRIIKTKSSYIDSKYILMDIYEGKKIHLVRTKETEPFVIRCNLSLAQILVSNLVKNSLVHNREGGELHIATTPSSLTIMNLSLIHI